MSDDDRPKFDPDSVEFKDYQDMIKVPEDPITTMGKAWGAAVSQGVMDKERIKAAVQIEWDAKKALAKKQKEEKKESWKVWIFPVLMGSWFFGIYVIWAMVIFGKADFVFLLAWAAGPWLTMAALFPAFIAFMFVIFVLASLFELPYNKWKSSRNKEEE